MVVRIHLLWALACQLLRGSEARKGPDFNGVKIDFTIQSASTSSTAIAGEIETLLSIPESCMNVQVTTGTLSARVLAINSGLGCTAQLDTSTIKSTLTSALSGSFSTADSGTQVTVSSGKVFICTRNGETNWYPQSELDLPGCPVEAKSLTLLMMSMLTGLVTIVIASLVVHKATHKARQEREIFKLEAMQARYGSMRFLGRIARDGNHASNGKRRARVSKSSNQNQSSNSLIANELAKMEADGQKNDPDAIIQSEMRLQNSGK